MVMMKNMNDLDTRNKLIVVARKLFARYSYESVSVRMICDEADTNVSSISYHFGGKEELYRTCLMEHGKGMHSTLIRILSEPDSAEECKVKMKIYISEMLENSVNDIDVMKMIIREVDSNLKIAEDVFKDVYLRLGETFQAYVRKSQEKGYIRKDIIPEFLDKFIHTQSFMSIKFCDISIKLGKGDLLDKSYRDQLVDQLMKILIHGVFVSP
jgi:AcrR family transcriptional regulator